MPQINYNERSWAIDVISEINLYLANKSWHVKSGSVVILGGWINIC